MHLPLQTADKATVEEIPLPVGWGSGSEEERDEELIKRAVIAAVVPGVYHSHGCLEDFGVVTTRTYADPILTQGLQHPAPELTPLDVVLLDVD
jgi:hypothetical protein